jgi:hypothetical protein
MLASRRSSMMSRQELRRVGGAEEGGKSVELESIRAERLEAESGALEEVEVLAESSRSLSGKLRG